MDENLDPREQALLRLLMDFVLTVACPIVWHDKTLRWPKPIYGATCFFLQLGEEPIGVTANHVVSAFEAQRTANPNLICQLKTSLNFDLIGALIDRDDELDVATFRVSQELLTQVQSVPIDCRGSWPPPEPTTDNAVAICGFPEHMRTPLPNGAAELRAWGALTGWRT